MLITLHSTPRQCEAPMQGIRGRYWTLTKYMSNVLSWVPSVHQTFDLNRKALSCRSVRSVMR